MKKALRIVYGAVFLSFSCSCFKLLHLLLHPIEPSLIMPSLINLRTFLSIHDGLNFQVVNFYSYYYCSLTKRDVQASRVQIKLACSAWLSPGKFYP